MRSRLSATICRVFLSLTLVILPGLLLHTHAYAREARGFADWEILFDTTNLTNAAAPIPMGQTVLLNLSGVGPMLGVMVMPEPNGYQIRSADGREWHWETGGSSLYSDSQMISLETPGIQEGSALYLDPKAISELCGVPVSVDAASRQITFRRHDVVVSKQIQQAELPDGWQSFTIEKPKSTKQSTAKLFGQKTANPMLPPAHDRLNLGVGLGYVQGADFGMEVTGSGKLAGGDISMATLMTLGELGARIRSSHLLWLDRQGGNGIEAGDMYSETWGLVQGVRYSWNIGGNHWPTISMNMNTGRTDNPKASMSYIDEFKISNSLNVRGEVGTDKSRYVNVRYDDYPLQMFAFKRSLAPGYGESEGVFGALSLSRSVSLFYGTTSSTDRLDHKTTYKNAGIRIPLFKRWGLVLGQTDFESETGNTSSRSAGLTVPITSTMHLYLRYQKNSLEVDTASGQLVNIQNSTDSLLTSLSLLASRRVHLDYQRNRIAQQGRTVYYEQLVTNYTLSPNTSLQAVSGFPNIADPNTLRLRLNHRLQDNTSLVIDYGRLSPYQSTNDVFGKRGFMIMFKKTWPLSVPALGGKVAGTVLDQLGKPVQNIAVHMGRYTAVSDKDGHYSFECVPAGNYKMSIAQESVPADYRVETTDQEIDVIRATERKVDFMLIPSGCILGQVFIDKNENNEYDPGEGVADVAMCANDHLTATDRDGRFGFFNLDPGRYIVRVAAEYLNKKYLVRSTAALDVDLPPSGSVTDLRFQLELRKKPIVFTALE